MRWQVALLTLCLGTPAAAAAQATPPPAARDSVPPVRSRVRFRGAVPLQTPEGRDSARVEIRDWIVRSGVRLDRLEVSGRGTLIVHVRAGDVVTTIAGRREERREGQVWTVPPGVAMGLETGRDEAVLQTIEVR